MTHQVAKIVSTTIAPIDLPVRVKDIRGQKFNMLTAVSFLGVYGQRKHAKWLFRCDCGNDCIALASNVIAGTTKACGCLMQSSKVRHGDSASRTYHIYYGMLDRCLKPGRRGYERYGGAGITVCDRWRESYKNFIEDMGHCPEGMSLDRVNPLGNYEPGNCEWSHIVEQNNNRKSRWLAYAKAEREKTIQECVALIRNLPSNAGVYVDRRETEAAILALSKGDQS